LQNSTFDADDDDDKDTEAGSDDDDEDDDDDEVLVVLVVLRCWTYGTETFMLIITNRQTIKNTKKGTHACNTKHNIANTKIRIAKMRRP
jgi:hypothetical protein